MGNLQPKMNSFLAFLLLALVFWPTCLWSQENASDQPPGLKAWLDRTSAEVGTVVELRLSYQLPEGAYLPPDPEIRGLEGMSVVERIGKPGEIRMKLLVDRLEDWKSGILSLPYLNGEGKAHFLEAKPLSLIVLSNLGDNPAEVQLRPIQPIFPTRSLWLMYGPWGMVLLILLLATLGFLWWHRKNRARRDFVELEQTPHIRALRELEELLAQNLFEKGKSKDFYFRFTAIVKRYLESLKGFPAVEFTTEEIAAYLHMEQDQKLLPLLREADLVKFADTIPTLAKKDEDVETLLTYIQETASVLEERGQVGYKVPGA